MEFPAVLANDDVSLDIRKGEVFALVGENGAGKTTLMNILYGIHEPTNGEVYIRGRKVERFSPKTAISMGVGMVHQHFMLVPSFTVAQNIVMSREPRRLGVLFDNKAAEAAAQKLVEEYGLVVDPAAVVREIGVGLQQRVEILKTLYRGADILILDEPTAVLTPQETDELFAVIRRVVRELGMTVIIITHKLYEVMAISDRVGVMRKGRLIGVENTCDVDEKKLASMMVGRPVLYDRLEKTGEAGAEQIRVSGLTVCDDRGLVAVDGLSLSVRAGEVLGIAAIEGNGQSELLEAITGMRRVERGTVEVCGQNVTGKTAGEIRKVGLSHIPEDRLATGVSRSASVTDNLLMGKQRDKAFSGFAFHQRRSSIERYAEEVYERFDIRGAGNLLGPEQSGYLMSVGYDLYLKLLEEAVLEERGEEKKIETECAADLTLNANIPERYVASPEQRMDLYRRIAAIRTNDDASDLMDEMIDRYGEPPKPVLALLDVALLRAAAAKAGVSDITQKKDTLRFTLAVFRPEALVQVCGLTKYKFRLTLSAGETPMLTLKLKPGADVLETALELVEDLKLATQTLEKA